MAGVGITPGGSVVAEDIRDLKSRAAHACRALRRRLTPAQRCEPIERAGDGTDGGCGDAGIQRRGVELGVTQQRLDDANIDILLEQMRGKAVPTMSLTT
jgi:hypothetical protein